MPPYLTLVLILWDESYKMANYGTNQVHKQFYLPHCLHPRFPSSQSPTPQYLPLFSSLHPTLVHLFFLIGLAAGSNTSEGAYDENTGTPTASMTAKQVKNSILGQPKGTGIHAASISHQVTTGTTCPDG